MPGADQIADVLDPHHVGMLERRGQAGLVHELLADLENAGIEILDEPKLRPAKKGEVSEEAGDADVVQLVARKLLRTTMPRVEHVEI